jgi:hypothetical protein
MKKYISLLAACTFTAVNLYAQVTSTDGTFTSQGATNLRLNTNTTTRLTILNANGFVGIGTTPSEMLHVNGNILSAGNISSSGSATSSQFAALTGNFSSGGAANLSFLTNSTSRMTILNSSGFVGIGTTPSEMLHVNGNVLSTGDITSNNFFSANGNFNSGGSSNLSFLTNGTSRFTILNANGNIGIGTAAPEHKLHIAGDLLLDNGGAPTIYTGTGSTELNRYVQFVNSAGLLSSSGLKAGGILVSDTYSYANPSKNDLIVKGKVAIGTPLSSNPNNYTLAVNGKIGAKDVQIERNSASWPDYVFAPSYQLPSLREVEQYIQKNQHLQDVPSAKEIEKNGHSVGDMDAILLKKVEELTLYIIEQQKQIDALKKLVENK